MKVLDTTGVMVEVAGEDLCLNPDRAVFWSRRNTLLVADVHIGKDAAFRAAGIPLPAGGTRDVLSRLSNSLERTGAERLIVLGDFFHSESGRDHETLDQLAQWRSEWSALDIIVVAGNHDIRTGLRDGEIGIKLIPKSVIEEPFVLQHHPEESVDGYVMAGHLHPTALLRDGRIDTLRLPCFVFGERLGILPAFSRFTGRPVYHPVASDRVFVVAENEVIQVS